MYMYMSVHVQDINSQCTCTDEERGYGMMVPSCLHVFFDHYIVSTVEPFYSRHHWDCSMCPD